MEAINPAVNESIAGIYFILSFTFSDLVYISFKGLPIDFMVNTPSSDLITTVLP